MDKKGQTAILIIVAILVVAGVILLFLINKNPNLNNVAQDNPKVYVEDCIKRKLIDLNEKIIENNGYINGNDNFFLYSGEKVPYLCKSSEFYASCINQEPSFLGKIRNDVEKEMIIGIDSCFSSLKKNVEDKGYNVEYGKTEFEVSFNVNILALNINKRTSISKSEDSKNYDGYNVEIKSELYNLVKLSETIVNYESQYCQFDEINWMRAYRDIKIDRFRAGEQTKVYTLTDRDSGNGIKFAVRTCILPAGI